jgi:hypothetical protein
MNTDPEDPDPTTGSPTADERPLGVSLLTWLLWFWAGAVVLVFLGFAVGDGPIMLSGSAVPRDEALARVVPALLPMGLAVIGAALALGLGRPWGRPVVLLPFIIAAFGPALTGLGATTAGDLLLAVAAVLPIVALLVWYLYFTEASRSYFDGLRARREPSLHG